MDTITVSNDCFILNTKDISYVFVIDKYKHLEHVHFGSRIETKDLEALRLKRHILYGTTLMYDDRHDDIYTMDALPFEYGSYGRGDFKEAAIEIESDSSYSTDFRYASYEIIDGDTKIEGLPSSYGAQKTLLVHLIDKDTGLGLDLYYAIYPDENVISRRCVLINDSDRRFVLHLHQFRHLHTGLARRLLRPQKQPGLHHQKKKDDRKLRQGLGLQSGLFGQSLFEHLQRRIRYRQDPKRYLPGKICL